MSSVPKREELRVGMKVESNGGTFSTTVTIIEDKVFSGKITGLVIVSMGLAVTIQKTSGTKRTIYLNNSNPQFIFRIVDQVINSPSDKQEGQETNDMGTSKVILPANFENMVNKETLALVQAGYLNTDLSRTAKCRTALDTIMFNKFQSDIVKLAKTELEEEAKSETKKSCTPKIPEIDTTG